MRIPSSIQVSELQSIDIPLIVNYWTQSDSEYLKSLGVDLAKLPTGEQLTSMLQHQIELPYKEKGNYALIVFANDQAIGHVNINDIDFGNIAKMHLHIWSEEWRKRGVGMMMLQKSIPYFFDKFQLKRLLCEPYAYNEAPNRVLEKVGFKFVKKYTTIPGSINFEQEVNQWQIKQQ